MGVAQIDLGGPPNGDAALLIVNELEIIRL
jgi:hypothetical protein